MARRHGPARLAVAALAAFIVAFLAIPVAESRGVTTGAGVAARPGVVRGADAPPDLAAPAPRRISSATTTATTTTTTTTLVEAAPGPEPVLHDGRVIGEPATPPAQTRVAAIARRPVYAVVVGVNPAPLLGLDQLSGAVNDANDMAASLMALGADPANVRVLRDGEATAGAILEAVDWLVAVAGPDATVIFSFAGHVLKLGVNTEALVAVDGGLVTDERLAARLTSLAARDAWFVFETCFGGGFTELLGPGRAVTAAADAHSLAYESAGLGRSYLGEFVVRQGLLQSRAGAATVQEAVAYAQATLGAVRPDRQIVHYDQTTAPISLDGLIRLTAPG